MKKNIDQITNLLINTILFLENTILFLKNY